jgi:hypothetical protein
VSRHHFYQSQFFKPVHWQQVHWQQILRLSGLEVRAVLGVPTNMPRNSNALTDDGQDSLRCVCGRTFTLTSALSKHRNACPISKKRLQYALNKAKELWTGLKRRHRQNDASDTSQCPPTHPIPSESPGLLRVVSSMQEVCGGEILSEQPISYPVGSESYL